MSEPWRNDERIAGAHVKISHVREDGHLMRTVASISDGDNVHMGVAMRHPNDPNFSRKRGRRIAVGRAKFALARSLKFTERVGRDSRYDLIVTVSQDNFLEAARKLGIPIPDPEIETEKAV